MALTGRWLCWCAPLLLCLATATAAVVDGQSWNTADRWLSFKTRCHKIYSSQSEDDRRHTLWEMRISDISRHNSEHADGKHHFTLADNCFADLTEEEMQLKFGFLKPPPPPPSYRRRRRGIVEDELLPLLPVMPTYRNTIPVDQLPVSVNWTSMPGWVGAVVDQGNCGSCWAVSATAALEAQYFNLTGSTITLSRQNLIDCAFSQGNYGCLGGFTHAALWYVKEKGIEAIDNYPDISDQTGWSGTCQYRESLSVLNVTGWQLIDSTEAALQQAVALVGPVAVAVHVDQSFVLYSGGVYSGYFCTSSERLNHALLLVGYGVTNDRPYWLLRNSWGESWGMNGYMMLARNADNMCGVASEGVFPVITANRATSPSSSSSPSGVQTATTTTTTTTTHHRRRHSHHSKMSTVSQNIV